MNYGPQTGRTNMKWLNHAINKTNITVPNSLDVIVSPRTVDCKIDRLAELGDRLQKVRDFRCERMMSNWATSHWTQVERQLQRKINLLKHEMELV